MFFSGIAQDCLNAAQEFGKGTNKMGANRIMTVQGLLWVGQAFYIILSSLGEYFKESKVLFSLTTDVSKILAQCVFTQVNC